MAFISEVDNIDLKKELYKIYISDPSNLFDSFIDLCKNFYDKPAHNFTEMRNRNNKKLRGDIFEEFCVLYLKYVCKYRKKVSYKSKIMVTWKELSTFYALCLRTGPWKKYIVMTNCDYVTHQGKKNNNDLSICIGTFRNINKEKWLDMCGTHFHKLSDTNLPDNNSSSINNEIPNIDKLREMRLKRFV